MAKNTLITSLLSTSKPSSCLTDEGFDIEMAQYAFRIFKEIVFFISNNAIHDRNMRHPLVFFLFFRPQQ